MTFFAPNPTQPDQFKVGDVVVHADGDFQVLGTLRGLEDRQAWVAWWDGDWGTYWVEDLAFVERPE